MAVEDHRQPWFETDQVTLQILTLPLPSLIDLAYHIIAAKYTFALAVAVSSSIDDVATASVKRAMNAADSVREQLRVRSVCSRTVCPDHCS